MGTDSKADAFVCAGDYGDAGRRHCEMFVGKRMVSSYIFVVAHIRNLSCRHSWTTSSFGLQGSIDLGYGDSVFKREN